MKLSFTKMQASGNDFVVLDRRGSQANALEFGRELAISLCDRRLGVGADQVLLIEETPKAHARMKVWNADGSTSEMCGNGLRAVALYLISEGTSGANDSIKIETGAGVKTVRSLNGGTRRFQVDMGKPRLGAGFGGDGSGEYLSIEGESLRYYQVDMGNPHAVFYLSAESTDLLPSVGASLGPAIETHARFPKRTNVEFVVIENPSRIHVNVWERGAGQTLACGSGACAAAVATLARGKAQPPLEVQLPGGVLQIIWDGEEKSVLMEGPAQEVYRGEIDLLPKKT